MKKTVYKEEKYTLPEFTRQVRDAYTEEAYAALINQYAKADQVKIDKAALSKKYCPFNYKRHGCKGQVRLNLYDFASLTDYGQSRSSAVMVYDTWLSNKKQAPYKQ